MNRFAYANGNPISSIDPFGTMAQDAPQMVVSVAVGTSFTIGDKLVNGDPGYIHGDTNFGVSLDLSTILSDPLNSVVFSYNSVAVATSQGGGMTLNAGLGASGGFNNSLPNTIVQNLLSGSPTLGDVETVSHSELDVGAVEGGSIDTTKGAFTYGHGIYDDLGFAAGGMASQQGTSKTFSVSLADAYNAVVIYNGLPLPLILPPPHH
jgi:hypothetical protein